MYSSGDKGHSCMYDDYEEHDPFTTWDYDDDEGQVDGQGDPLDLKCYPQTQRRNTFTGNINDLQRLQTENRLERLDQELMNQTRDAIQKVLLLTVNLFGTPIGKSQ